MNNVYKLWNKFWYQSSKREHFGVGRLLMRGLPKWGDTRLRRRNNFPPVERHGAGHSCLKWRSFHSDSELKINEQKKKSKSVRYLILYWWTQFWNIWTPICWIPSTQRPSQPQFWLMPHQLLLSLQHWLATMTSESLFHFSSLSPSADGSSTWLPLVSLTTYSSTMKQWSIQSSWRIKFVWKLTVLSKQFRGSVVSAWYSLTCWYVNNQLTSTLTFRSSYCPMVLGWS